MFGTLVSTGLDRETLEFIENPDPVAAAIRRNNGVSIRTVFGEADNQGKSSQDVSLDSLDCNKLNDGCIDESLFMPWIMDTPMQQSSPSRSRSSSGGIQTRDPFGFCLH
ncbi:hypothetical protein RIB2604_01806370 [Aspergillus luchuensis]|uniref:Uncharacterized protein n=1 Tax=Aspergillus kawachii TaxID=1069201 RepID=A0A146FG05_ASPKA|nr:hypothetical protein RIB2604_01806370 [Aspergillus luchuensis]